MDKTLRLDVTLVTDGHSDEEKNRAAAESALRAVVGWQVQAVRVPTDPDGLTRYQLDQLRCAVPGCGGGEDGLVLAAACHPDAATHATYRDGSVVVECAVCLMPVTSIAVHDAPPPGLDALTLLLLAETWDTAAGLNLESLTPGSAAAVGEWFRMCAAQLRGVAADGAVPVEIRSLFCAIPDDCPNGPDRHLFVPPVGDLGVLPCCKQPWESSPLGVPLEDSHIARILSAVLAKTGTGIVSLTLDEYRNAGQVRFSREDGRLDLESVQPGEERR